MVVLGTSLGVALGDDVGTCVGDCVSGDDVSGAGGGTGSSPVGVVHRQCSAVYWRSS